MGQRRADCAIESLDVPDLHQHASLPGSVQQCVSFLERRGNWLLNKDVLATLDCRARNREVLGGRNDDDYRVRCFEQSIQGWVRAHLELFLDFTAPPLAALEKAAELSSTQVAQYPYVVKAETARADDTNARSLDQITTPRSLASTNRTSSRTSASDSSSLCTCSIAWETLRSERNSSR